MTTNAILETLSLEKNIENIKSLYRPSLFVEYLGTSMFVLTIGLAAHNAGDFAPIAIGFMLGTLVFAFGYISGAHFNPAVTTGVYFTKNMDLKKAIKYILCQTAGGITGAALAMALTEQETKDTFPAPEPNVNGSDVGKWAIKALVAEFIYTFILVSVVLNVACSKQRDNNFYGIAIGFTVTSAAYSVGGLSGGGFNPAVSFGLQLVKCAFSKKCEPLKWFWLYWMAPLGGAVLAGMMFKLCTMTETEDEAEPASLTLTESSNVL